jgi:CheY-like chemotaxis protein
VDKPFVLLADDNEATCTLMTALLRSEYDIETAGDGGEAIEKLKNRQYAAILLDLRMPGVDGYAVLDFLRAERPDLLAHVLVVTASVGAKEMERVRAYDICGIIAKPFEVETLFNAVRDCTGGDGPTHLRATMLSSGVLLLLAEMFVSYKP